MHIMCAFVCMYVMWFNCVHWQVHELVCIRCDINSLLHVCMHVYICNVRMYVCVWVVCVW